MQWSDHYWARVDTGATVKVGQFAFSNTALNNPLFNPVRAARPTLEELKIISASDCDGMTALQPGWGNTAIADAFREAMKSWRLTTNSASNAAGTAVHIALITGAPGGSGVTWTIVGDNLISEKLPWLSASGNNPSPTIAGSISPETQQAIEKLMNIGPIIASASAGTSIAQSLITGEESHADKFERGVRQLLVDGGWNGTTWRVDAVFGVFGSLPLVGVTFDDGFVLVDSVNGGVDGPFEPGTHLQADTLLAGHVEYTAASSVKYFALAGCESPVAVKWRPAPPSWGTLPWGPPSWFLFGTSYFCTLTIPAPLWPRVDCRCIREGTSTDASGRAVVVREVCECTSCAGTGTTGGPPSGPVAPSGTPPTPGAATTCTCTIEYFH